MASKARQTENDYSPDEEINQLALQAVSAVERAGHREPDFGALRVEKMRKISTLAMKADANNAEPRFRPGSRLRTYTGVRNPDGTLTDETYVGEAYIKEGTTIYRNVGAICYPDDEPDPSKRGRPIRGRFETEGTFVEDVMGPDILHNEYATDSLEHPKRKYGIEPEPGVWTEGLAQIPSYLVQIPENKGEVWVHAGSDKLISVKGGDFLVVDPLGGGAISVQGIERSWKERTYRPWDVGAKR